MQDTQRSTNEHEQRVQAARDWIGHEVIDENNSNIGKIETIFVDDDTREPEWLVIKTGWLGQKVRFAPLRGATAQGERMQLAVSKDFVKGAPQVEPGDHLDRDAENRLCQYYGLATGAPSKPASTEAPPAARGTSEDAMTRSEEELQVEKMRHETGRARLRKYLVTEDVNITVPVAHEEVRVVHEPITGENREAALSGEDLAEREHEVVLHEEEVEAHKRVVPKERVRLETEKVVENRELSEQVQKEKIALEGAAPAQEKAGLDQPPPSQPAAHH